MERLEEAKRWLMQALRDLEAATSSLESGYYEWSCFQSHQAAEKAVKALLYAHGKSAWGHSITELLGYVKSTTEVPEELFYHARELDRHYIPSRYPNAFESGYPALYYDKITGERAISACKRIIEWVREQLRLLGLSE